MRASWDWRLFRTAVDGRPMWGGVNLAITYGLALILGALVIAALYMPLVRGMHQQYSGRKGGR